MKDVKQSRGNIVSGSSNELKRERVNESGNVQEYIALACYCTMRNFTA